MATDNRTGIGSVGRKLIGIAGFVAAAAVLPGCFIESSSSPGVCGDGQIQTSWVLTENGGQVQCAIGDEVDLRVDTDAMTATFPCGSMSGLTDVVQGGVSHNLTFTLFDAGGHVLSMTQPMNLFVPCGTIKNTPVVTFELNQ